MGPEGRYRLGRARASLYRDLLGQRRPLLDLGGMGGTQLGQLVKLELSDGAQVREAGFGRELHGPLDPQTDPHETSGLGEVERGRADLVVADEPGAFQEERELAGGEAPGLVAVPLPRGVEAALFQALRREDEAGAVPMQHAGLFPVARDEEEHVAFERVAACLLYTSDAADE